MRWRNPCLAPRGPIRMPSARAARGVQDAVQQLRTAHFSLDEFTRSQKAQELGIDNLLPDGLIFNAGFTLAGAERIRACLNVPVDLSSGYRCPALNKAVGGSEHSQHMEALAIDFKAPRFGDPQKIVLTLSKVRHLLGIDQLILEADWVHASFSLTPRYEVLRALVGGKMELILRG